MTRFLQLDVDMSLVVHGGDMFTNCPRACKHSHHPMIDWKLVFLWTCRQQFKRRRPMQRFSQRSGNSVAALRHLFFFLHILVLSSEPLIPP